MSIESIYDRFLVLREPGIEPPEVGEEQLFNDIYDYENSLLSYGCEYYPFSPQNVREALVEASDDFILNLSKMMEIGAPISGTLRDMVINYWRRCAKKEAEKRLRN